MRDKVKASRRFEEEESLRWDVGDEGEPKISMSLSSLAAGVRGIGGMVISLSSGRGQSEGGGSGAGEGCGRGGPTQERSGSFSMRNF